MKKLLFAALLLLSLVGGAAPASADSGNLGPGGVSWEDGFGATPEGVSWQ